MALSRSNGIYPKHPRQIKYVSKCTNSFELMMFQFAPSVIVQMFTAEMALNICLALML